MCSHAQYFQLVTTSLPALTILDGALVGVIGINSTSALAPYRTALMAG
jgi:hypothetical protein